MKLIATLILSTVMLVECGPKQVTQFTLDRPLRLSGQLVDPVGAAVAKLKLVVKCGTKTYVRTTDSAGKYDFGVLPAGDCKIGTTNEGWAPPEVKCDSQGCALQKLRLGRMVLTSQVFRRFGNAETN